MRNGIRRNFVILAVSSPHKSEHYDKDEKSDRPTRGEVIIDGSWTNTMSNKVAELRNQVIGFIFQFHFLLPEFTALENVLVPYGIQQPRLSRDILKRADELFELVGISRVKNNLAAKMRPDCDRSEKLTEFSQQNNLTSAI